jgi:hypothetical protein
MGIVLRNFSQSETRRVISKKVKSARINAKHITLGASSSVPVIALPKPLFTTVDIATLFARVIVQDADLAKVATDLDRGIRRAVTAQAHDQSRLKPSEQRETFEEIIRYGSALRDALGCASDSPDIPQWFADLTRHNLAIAPGLINPDAAECDLEYAAQGFIDLPRVLNNLIRLAEYSAEKCTKSRRGPRPNRFGPKFYSDFCLAWEAATGVLPLGRITGEIPDDELTSIVRLVTTAAADAMVDPAFWAQSPDHNRRHRLDAEISDEQCRAAAAALGEIAGTSDRTIADAIEAGVRRHRQFRASHLAAIRRQTAAEEANRAEIDEKNR